MRRGAVGSSWESVAICCTERLLTTRSLMADGFYRIGGGTYANMLDMPSPQSSPGSELMPLKHAHPRCMLMYHSRGGRPPNAGMLSSGKKRKPSITWHS